ncbi:MAG TPA: AMP-binding protein [Candidatus Baltobacteraceae bacterium]|jgi:malonyl-CoA/methylmalonyl-CoA synthetase|nr:AMP-binding protein [Candidatus Baltobacteraceae bacterium]
MLLDLFDAALADCGRSPALDDLTHREVHDGALRVAARFAELGVRRGDRVAIYSENRHGFAYAYLAALRLGAIAVPANVLYRANDLAHLLGDSAPSLIVCSPASAPYLAEIDTGTRAIDMAEIETCARDAHVRPLDLQQRAQPEDPALIVYTSGTTGVAKGAVLSHRNLAAIAAQLMAAWRWESNDVLLVTLPLFHVHGLIAGLTTSLAAGSRVLLRERFDADAVLERLSRGDVTMFFGVPTMYVRMIERLRDGGAQPPQPLRLYVSGSAALSEQTHRDFASLFGASILERYGATEFGFALGNRYAGPRVAGSVGIPLPGVRVRIDGPAGELLVNGPNVFAGYWRRPDATAAAFAFDDDGTRWYRSGDLATYDPSNDVYRIVGRIKELIITGGFNVYPREVEAAIETYAGVRACAVVGKPDAARGELPVAFIEIEGNVDPSALDAWLRERLASFKIPKEIRIVEQLPRNAMGKLDKPALRSIL